MTRPSSTNPQPAQPLPKSRQIEHHTDTPTHRKPRRTSTGGVITHDPGFTNTGSTTSAITYIDGDAGILRYRGYPIEQLAQSSSFLETSYLLIYGELPTRPEALELKGMSTTRRRGRWESWTPSGIRRT